MYYYPVNYKIIGKGKRFVLFLHGWGGSTNSFLHVARKLENTCKTVLIDFYGFGKTKFPKVSLDTYEYTTQLYLFLKSKNIEEVSIVAHSFGGRVALILSSIFDIKIDKLVLIDSAGVLPKRTLHYRFKVCKYKIYKKLSKLNIISDKKLSKFGSDEYKQLDSVQKRSYVKIVNQGLEYLFKKINSDVLIVWGEKDRTTPLSMANVLNKNISKSHLFVYKNSGHFSYIENLSHFCKLVQTFLKV